LYEPLDERIMAGPSKIKQDWLSFIRPHLLPYDALGVSGERLKYIAKLSRETGLKDNSLRRYIAAAQFLEAEGWTEIPTGKRLPVAAVERIARIAALRPGVQQRLIHEVLRGQTSVASLAGTLDMAKKRAVKAQRDLLFKPLSSPEGFEHLANAAKAELASRGIANVASMKEFPFEQFDTSEYYEWRSRPAMAIKLPEDRQVAVMSERLLQQAILSQRKEFKRNLLSAIACYDYVLVDAPSLQADIEKLRKTVLPSIRERIISLDLDEPSQS
jgi:hypothetical protein